ncbi:MAG: ABC transporter permease [Candidatus Ancillula sp.]|jgi:peptide/nickel transport system permease protein|nr:ABC transporter permease [Candidatus Ancillula sp.]
MSRLGNLPIIKHIRQSVGLQCFMLITGLAIVVLFVLTAIFAPLIAPYGFSQIKDASGVSFGAQKEPSAEHIWGTTVGGLDVFSRVIWGAQTALISILVAVIASSILGILLGLVSGYFGGKVDRVLVVIADAIYSFPSLLLAILLAIMINSTGGNAFAGILAAGISITVVFVPQYFRVIRSEVLRIKSEAFVESAKAIHAPITRILFKHVLRNSTRTLPIVITMNAAEAILTLAALGFLGMGIEPSSASEWGYDLNRAVSDVTSNILWTSIFPGAAIVLVVIGVTLLGEGLNDLSDPRLRIRRKPKAFDGTLPDDGEVKHD